VVATYTSGKRSGGTMAYIIGVVLVFAVIIIGLFWGKVKALADASLTRPEALAQLRAKLDGTNVSDSQRGLLAHVTIDSVTGITKLDHNLVRVEFTFGLELTAAGEKLEADLERDSQLDWVGQCEYCGDDQPLVGATHLWGIWKLSPKQRAHSIIRFRKYADGWRITTQ